nr:exosome complex component CSL4 isoform X3 [Geotrypetes seraphini]XP_033796141.1 exosome complex component CSL4 isoform X3 [Geotrypetes seraphini]XP_033796142.1 exosome complex component CSL4 isoform X3 [Geotrypetes seraphini]XP_033796143.1 exosome complex component CSL4 isoform X3 [Geotrypetes seraphini]
MAMSLPRYQDIWLGKVKMEWGSFAANSSGFSRRWFPGLFSFWLPVLSVVRETESQLLPDVGAVVTCKVCSINSRFAKVQILYIGSTPLKNTFRGTIRKEDIRATEKDKVEVYKCFRPGDIVLAKVISLGDVQSNYLLTTAENELGVVVARSEAGKKKSCEVHTRIIAHKHISLAQHDKSPL